MEKIKIVHIIGELGIGGAERLLLDLGRKIDKNVFDFRVITLGRGGRLIKDFEAAGLPVTVVPRNYMGDWHVVGRITAWLREWQPDVVHTHLFGGDFWGITAARRAKVPVIISTKHDIISEGWLKNLLCRKKRAYCQRVVAISQASKKFLIEHDHFDEKKITVIYNGIDMSRFDAGEPTAFKNEQIVFGTIGRLEKVKNHEQLISACRFLKRSNWHLNVIGDGSLRSKLEILINKYGLAENISLLGFLADVREQLEGMDVFVLPSKSEGLSLSVIEAAAAGKFIIATNVGGVAEIITDEVTGKLFNPEDLESLVRDMNWVFDHTDEARAMTVRLQESVRAKFDINQLIKEYENLYHHLTKK